MSAPSQYLGAGFGLRGAHLPPLLATPELVPPVLELTPSHVFGDVERVAPLVGRCAFVLHDVLGSPATLTPLPRTHLERVRLVARRVDAHEYSDHLAMTRAPGGLDLGHLVPVPLTHELLEHLCIRVRELREFLELPVALELPTTSLSLAPLPDALSEGEFMHELVAHGGCGLHLDLENLRIDAANGLAPLPAPTLDEDASALRKLLSKRLCARGLTSEAAQALATRLAALPLAAVTRVHLAGGTQAPDGWHIDSHAGPVHTESLALLDALRGLIEPRALIIERDARLPSPSELSAEARALDEHWRPSTSLRSP